VSIASTPLTAGVGILITANKAPVVGAGVDHRPATVTAPEKAGQRIRFPVMGDALGRIHLLSAVPKFLINDRLMQAVYVRELAPMHGSPVEAVAKHMADRCVSPSTAARTGHSQAVQLLGNRAESPSLCPPLKHPANPARLCFVDFERTLRAPAVSVSVSGIAPPTMKPLRYTVLYPKQHAPSPALILHLRDHPRDSFDDQAGISPAHLVRRRWLDGLIDGEYLNVVLSTDGADLSAESIGAPEAIEISNYNQVNVARADNAHQLGKLGAVGAEFIQPVVVSAVALNDHFANYFPDSLLAEVMADLKLLRNAILLLSGLSPSGDGGDYDGAQVALPIIESGVIII